MFLKVFIHYIDSIRDQKPSKKQKLSTALNASNTPKVVKGKEKAFNRETIPIPVNEEENGEVELSDQDLQLFEEHGPAANFLTTMDKKAITR